MTDLSATYEELARAWTRDELAARYDEARRLARGLPECDRDRLIRRPIAILGAAVPACATASVAIHVIHVLPATRAGQLVDDLLETASNSSALALHRCHRGLELDGVEHDYSSGDWLACVYDIAAPLLESARADLEPPSLVLHVQDALQWLSSAIVQLDEGSPEVAATIAEALARLLVVFAFTQANGR
jgi:hypothetical protein